MDESIHHTEEMSWRKLREFPGTAEVKVLREEAEGGAKAMLVRLAAGGQIAPHAHVATVQHYVLEGECESQGKTLAAGTYRCLPGHADVAPISTKSGATILMIYDPICP